MSLVTVIHAVSALSGAALAGWMAVSRRFGAASGFLAAFLAPCALACALLACEGRITGMDTEGAARGALAMLLASAPGGLLFALLLAREDAAAWLRARALVLGAALVPGPVLALCLLFPAPGLDEAADALGDDISLGPAGYGAAIYLLATSVLALACLERTLRCAQEHVRWEIKFLVLGLGAALAFFVHLASRIILYGAAIAPLHVDSMRVFPIVLLTTSCLVLVSARRSSAAHRIVVGEGVVYGSIVSLAVGAFLIASSIVSQWTAALVPRGIAAEVVVFLLAAVLFTAVFLSAQVRHKVRRWVRRNVFAGRYDYRKLWMDASESIRSNDPPEVAAQALVDIVARSIGSDDVTVWARSGEGGKLRLLARRGCEASPPPAEVCDVLSSLEGIEEPLAGPDLQRVLARGDGAGFLRSTCASLLAPLRCGGETLGALTVGADRSGEPFDWEAVELLRVLCAYAARELRARELLAALVAAKEAEAFRSCTTFLLHDLKNFASTLSLVAQNASRHRGNPEFHSDAFQSILETAEKMKRLCSSLRTFSGAAPRMSREDLSRLVESVLQGMGSPIASKLRLDLSPLPRVSMDREDVARVVQNLVINAAEAIPESGTITVRTSQEGSSAVLRVQDDGCGIPREFLEKEVFQPFRTTKSNGLGIGLFQSKKILDAHGGTIRIDSVEGKGTVVTAVFPIDPDEERKTEQKTP